MSAQGGDSSFTPSPHTPPHPSSGAGSLHHHQDLSPTDHIALLHRALAQYEPYQQSLHQLGVSARQTAVQESNHPPPRDEPLERGRQGPQPPSRVVSPDGRQILPEGPSLRMGHPSDEALSVQAGMSGSAQLVTSVTGAPVPVAAATEQVREGGVMEAASLTAGENLNVALLALKHCQDALADMERRKREAEESNHDLLNQLSAAKRQREESEAALKDEITNKDDQIRELKRMLQQQQQQQQQQQNGAPDHDHHHQPALRPGIKRGRFYMSRARSVECANCKRVFPSEEDAGSSPCSYHPKVASELPNKMVAEVFPFELAKLRYWSCCQAIGAKVPPPCFQGQHCLQAV